MNVSNIISINLEQSFKTNYNQKTDLKSLVVIAWKE